jgi:hypothetical protein
MGMLSKTLVNVSIILRMVKIIKIRGFLSDFVDYDRSYLDFFRE